MKFLFKSEHISETDYENAANVWNNFEMKSLGEFDGLYAQSDTFLLNNMF